MNGKTLVDTNILIDFFNGNSSFQKKLEKLRVFVPAIVLGELYFGAEKSKNIRKNLRKIDDFFEFCTILEVNSITAKFYAQIKKSLQKAGRPIPENDIWIAAIAFQHKLSLATNDKHFAFVKNLKIENWVTSQKEA
jgi:tRNA(fMet)-specific endonuclease VapC